MKLSQAIREGAKIRPQCFSNPFTVDLDKNAVCGSCALGAAYEATMIESLGEMAWSDYRVATAYIVDVLSDEYPEMQKLMDSTGHNLADLIWHMNDGWETATRKHSREEIADIVESWGY